MARPFSDSWSKNSPRPSLNPPTIIIYWPAESPRHFAALRHLMPSISQKVLTEQLRELIADEIVHRERTGPVPAPVLYRSRSTGAPCSESSRPSGCGDEATSSDLAARFPSTLRMIDAPLLESGGRLRYGSQVIEQPVQGDRISVENALDRSDSPADRSAGSADRA